jgi:short-subunit dehydrogenase
MLKGIVRNVWKPALGVGGLLAVREAAGRLREESISGEVALVTGGSRGLGLVLAEHLLSEGCRVAICARDEAELERARQQLAARGDVLAVPCDVGDRAAVQRMVDEVTCAYGRIDLLINNAGEITVGPLEALDLADFEQAMRTMYWGVLYPTLAVLPQMRARRAGRIANITSFGGRLIAPHLVAYGAAKSAAIALSEGLRAELLADGITVTTVLPGELRTGSYRAARFSGNQRAEFRWFQLGATLPTTTSADRAATYIVQAIKRRQAELIFPWTVSLAVRAHGVAPGVTSNVLARVNRLLPDAEPGQTAKVAGVEVEPELRGPIWDAVTAVGRTDADRLNQAMPADAAEPPETDGLSQAGT